MMGECVLLLTKLCFHQDPQQILKESMNSVPVWLEPTAKFEASEKQNKQGLISQCCCSGSLHVLEKEPLEKGDRRERNGGEMWKSCLETTSPSHGFPRTWSTDTTTCRDVTTAHMDFKCAARQSAQALLGWMCEIKCLKFTQGGECRKTGQKKAPGSQSCL